MSLRELRKARGMTQEQLANKANVPRTRIVSYETGSDGKNIGSASLNVAIRIADALKVKDLRKLVAEDSSSPKENNAD